MRRTLVVLAAAAVTAGAVAPSAAAPKRKPITKTVTFHDATPDPTGPLVGEDGHCSGLLPREAAYVFRAPAKGSLRVSLSGFSGEWAMHLQNPEGEVLAEGDTTAPEQETLTVKVRKPVAIHVAPCNIAGTADATLKLVFTFS